MPIQELITRHPFITCRTTMWKQSFNLYIIKILTFSSITTNYCSLIYESSHFAIWWGSILVQKVRMLCPFKEKLFIILDIMHTMNSFKLLWEAMLAKEKRRRRQEHTCFVYEIRVSSNIPVHAFVLRGVSLSLNLLSLMHWSSDLLL